MTPTRLPRGLGRRSCALLTATAVASGAMLLAPTAALAYDDATVVLDMVLDADGEAIVDDVEHTEIAPGLDQVSFQRLSEVGWMQINVLKAQLSSVEAGYLGPDAIADNATISEMAEGTDALAAINGDFFDINNSGAPVGTAVDDGELLKSADPGRERVVAFGEDGLGRMATLFLEGSIALPDGELPLAGVNVTAAAAGSVAVYNAAWGDFSRGRILANGETGVEVQVQDGAVIAVGTPGEGRLEEGVQALVARPGEAADRLAALQVGDAVEVAYGLTPDAEDLRVAVGGQPAGEDLILEDGVVGEYGGNAYGTERHPRTAVGFSEDGATAYFVVVDGRTALSAGMTLSELGGLLADFGADDAINLDGGGSSQMNVREPGDSATSVQNSPSDGYERSDANGLGLFLSQAGSGELTGFAVAPAADVENADRVFPGLHRTLAALGHDETLTAVEGAPAEWTSSAAAATVADGVVTGAEPGTTVITASAGEASGEAELKVLGDLARIEASTEVINLETAGSTQDVRITGADAEGFTAPIEAGDVQIDNPAPDLFDVTANEDGTLRITATGTEGSALIGFEVDGHRTEIAVSVPLELEIVDDFSNAAAWTSAHDRAPGGSVTVGEGHEGAPGLHLRYDFTQSTGTRGQYAVAPNGGVEIPGQPQKLSAWIQGDGNGSLLRLQVRQANGIVSWLDAAVETEKYATWTDWRRIDFAVPSGLEFPLKLERVRVLETVASKQYTGEITFSKIYAYLPPEGVPTPENAPVEDPLVVPTGATDDAPLRVAVLSDSQFVARDPESGAVAGARDALREIVAEDPDVLLINGDFVDEASPADFELARRILDEELAGVDFPWYYVPGNHEIMGGEIANFEAAFGETTNVFDLDGTRFITLNSATGKLASDFEQLELLRDQLRAAAEDPSVTGVVLATHMPTNDPLPTAASQLTDRNEAELVDDWVQEFRESSGKSIAYVSGHVGVFHTSRVDGVPYVINGNSGKSPAATPADGGFTGWTMLGIDPEAGLWGESDAEWLEVEVQTRVDELTLDQPEQLRTGTTWDLDPVIAQDGTREFSPAWPASFAWSGSKHVHIGSVDTAPRSAVVALDPASGELTTLRAGKAELTLTVNDVSETVTLDVKGPRAN